MFVTSAFVVLFSSSFAAAQYGGYGSPGTTAAATSAATAAASVPSAPADATGRVNVNVGPNGQFRYDPQDIKASNGTLVTFFFPNSEFTHSVTQSSFASPCLHLAANGSTPPGFDSGLTKSTQFTLNITDDTKPIWFHCKQVTHCGMGMVGSINAPSTGNTFANFQAAAMKLGSAAPTETDTGAVTGGVDGIATAAPAATFSASSSASPSSSSNSNGSAAFNMWGSSILAIVLAGVILVVG